MMAEEISDEVLRRFPEVASMWANPMERRHFLQIMGASLAMVTLSGCIRPPEEQVLPHVLAPVGYVPTAAQYFATATTMRGFARGVLAKSVSGRPVKLEGNPLHPASRGATDVFSQVSLLGLYDPDRSQNIVTQGDVRTWKDFTEALAGWLRPLRRGAGLRILTDAVGSPTLADQMARLLRRFPDAKWHPWDPLAPDNARAGIRMAAGRDADVVYHFDRAHVVVGLDGDAWLEPAAGVRHARDFAGTRRVRRGQTAMSRLYVAESCPSLMGVKADHCLLASPGQVGGVAAALASALGVHQAAAVALPPDGERWVAAAAADLKASGGAGIVYVGDAQPPAVHAVAHGIHQALGCVGKTVDFIRPVMPRPPNSLSSLRGLVDDMRSGAVRLLLILGANPAYDAPVDIAFLDALRSVPVSVHCGLYADETGAECSWHVPAQHYLETWSDAVAYDGTISLVQPLLEPLYNGKSAHEMLAALMGEPDVKAFDVLQRYWRRRLGARFATQWSDALRRGVMGGTGPHPISLARDVEVAETGVLDAEPPTGVIDSQPQPSPAPSQRVILGPLSAPNPPGSPPRGLPVLPTGVPAEPGAAALGPLEVAFRPDPKTWDGCFANNAWAQEFPHPISKLTWDNAAYLSAATAARFGLQPGDIVRVEFEGRAIDAPVWPLNGHADGVVTLPLGYGRRRAGVVGTGVGFNAYALRTSNALWMGAGAVLRKTGRNRWLAVRQRYFQQDDRDLMRFGDLSQFLKDPAFAQKPEDVPRDSLYPPYPRSKYEWGMAIDLTACIGCGACTVACQVENNIPVVGRDLVLRERIMHWIRVDRYENGPESRFQPVPCMHCEDAPCELVCPVNATVHSDEGLNEMIYNRCVGTRYCSNNCPYKVRRFNFFNYSDPQYVATLELVNNPEVTVRPRGVMEKCSYCVQRINAARMLAEEEDRSIADGEMMTACQQVCPTGAIVFGNLNDPNSAVRRAKAEPLNYSMLGELNTRPRTTYLAEIRNPRPGGAP